MSLPAVPTSSAPSDARGAEPFPQIIEAETQSWEEPHPGVPLTILDSTSMQALGRTPSGGWRGDMAAKGYGYFRARPGVARRYARPTMRPRVSRSPRHKHETNYTTRQEDAAHDELTP